MSIVEAVLRSSANNQWTAINDSGEPMITRRHFLEGSPLAALAAIERSQKFRSRRRHGSVGLPDRRTAVHGA